MTRKLGLLRATAGLAAAFALTLAPLRLLRAAELCLLSEVEFSSGFRSSQYAGMAKANVFRVSNGRLIEIPAKLDPASAPDPAFLPTTISDAETHVVAIGGSATLPSPIRLLSMDKPDRFRATEVAAPGWLLGTVHLCDIPGRERILLFNLFNDDNRITHAGPDARKLMALDTATDQWVEASYDMYRFVRVLGGGRRYERSPLDSLPLHQRDGGQLVIPLMQGEIELGPPLPTDLRFKQGTHPQLFLRNSWTMAVAYVIRVDDPARPALPPPVTYRIFDKSKNAWHRLDIPGDISWNVRAFGPWMAGIIEENLRGKHFRLSPGRLPFDREAWTPYDTIDLYLTDQQIYRPGKLFLYHVQNRRYYEWDTHNGDCEVLLVEAGQVYYRVDQAIYRAPIGEKALGKPTLIVEGPDVPYVHWAFFGPNSVVPRGDRGK